MKKRAFPTATPEIAPTPTTTPTTTPTPTKPQIDPFKPPKPAIIPKPKAKEKEEDLQKAASSKLARKLKRVAFKLRRCFAQAGFENYSTDEIRFPIRIVYSGPKEKLYSAISETHRFLEREFSEDKHDFAKEMFKNEIESLVLRQDFNSLEEAQREVIKFCETFPAFKTINFQIKDAYDDVYPADIAAVGQQEILPVTQPQQLTIPGIDVEPPPPESPPSELI